LVSYLPNEKKPKEKIKMTFTNIKRNVVGRQRASDILPEKPGLAKYAHNTLNTREAFSLFLSDDFYLIFSNKHENPRNY